MRKIIILMLCSVLMVFNKGDTEPCKFEQVRFHSGFGVLFENGRLLTAYHLTEKNDKLIYFNKEKDIAVVKLFETDKKFSDFLVVKNDTDPFICIEWLIQKGDSGKAYVLDGRLAGVFIGRKGDKAVAATVSDEVLSYLCD